MNKYKQALIIFVTFLISLSIGVYYGYKVSVKDTHEHGLTATYTGIQVGDQYKWKICNYNNTVCFDTLLDVSRSDLNTSYKRKMYFQEDVDNLWQYYQLAEKLKLNRYLRR